MSTTSGAATVTEAVGGSTTTGFSRRDTGVRAVVRRELYRMRARRLYPLLLLILPVMGWGVLRAVFGSHVARELPVVVMDADGSALSRRVVRAIEATASVRVVAQTSAIGNVEQVLQRGEAYAVVVIPAGLEQQTARAQGTPILLYTNGQWLLPASTITRDVRMAVGTVSAQIEVGRRVARGAAPSTALVAAEPVRTQLHPLYNPALDYAAYLFLALIPTLLHVFVLVMAVHVVGVELKQSTAAQWLAAAGDRAGIAVVGKLLPYTLWYALLGSVMLEVALRSLDLPMAGNRPLLHAAMVLLVMAYQALGVLLVALTSNLRVATSASGFIAGPAFAVAGVSFPRFAMPVAGQLWSVVLPLSHYLELQTQQVIVGASVRQSAPLVATLMAFVAVPALLAVRPLRRVLRDPQYWGRT